MEHMGQAAKQLGYAESPGYFDAGRFDALPHNELPYACRKAKETSGLQGVYLLRDPDGRNHIPIVFLCEASTEEKALFDAAERTTIENAMASLKEIVKTDDVEAIQQKTQALAQASMKLGEAMYKASQAGAGAEGAPKPEAPKDDNVVDAEFSEVDENRKSEG